MRLLKKNLFVIATICLAVLFGSFAGISFLLNKNNVFADANVNLTVAKVKLYKAQDSDTYYALFNRDVLIDPDGDETKSIVVARTVDFNNLDSAVGNPFLDTAGEALNNSYNNSVIQVLSNTDNVFMLKNANLESGEVTYQLETLTTNNGTIEATLDTQEKTTTFYQKEFLLVQFTEISGESKLLSLSVNSSLTNASGLKNVDTLEEMKPRSTYCYSQFFDLNNTRELLTDGTKLDFMSEFDAQGLYNFEFTYNLKTKDQTSTENKLATSFYLLSESYYLNPNVDSIGTNTRDHTSQTFNSSKSDTNNQYTEPRLFNTQRISTEYSTLSPKVEEAYYYYNNTYTTNGTSQTYSSDYNGNPISNANASLVYPTIKYDASRYNLSYTKLIYGIKTEFTTTLDTQNDVLVVSAKSPTESYSYNITTTPSANGEQLTKQNGQYIANIVLDNVGYYTIDFNFAINGTILDSSDSTLFVKTENNNLLHQTNMFVFGYQLMHSEYKNQNGATELEMKSLQKGIYADISNVDITNYNITDPTASDFIANLSNGTTTIATTNQAPLFFRYYASLNYDSSYYYHFTNNSNTYKLDTSKSASGMVKLSSNQRFTDSGLYVVVADYKFPNYKFINTTTNLTESGNNENKKQIFVFEIKNIEPSIEFTAYTKDDKSDAVKLNAGGFTNKKVDIGWKNAVKSPFDVAPRITISKQSFNSDVATNITNTFNQSDLDSGLVTVSESEKYIVNVEYGPCTFNSSPDVNDYEYSASVTYTFVIDNQPISDIKFYSVDSQKLPLNSASKTNKNFMLIYGTILTEGDKTYGNQLKASGAKITAYYDYMPINANENIPTAPLSQNYDYIANGRSITTINKNVAYSPTAISPALVSTNASVMSSNGIYIFHFVDEAGNTATRYMLKDTTSPALLQLINDSYSVIPSSSANADNLVNQDTTIIFGKNKAIKLSSDVFNDDLLNQLKSEDAGYSIYNDGTDKYLTIAMDTQILKPNANSQIQPLGITVYYKDLNGSLVAPKDENIQKTASTYKIKAKDASGNEIKDNEQVFKIQVHDTLGNVFEGVVEMSFDKSNLQAQVSGSPAQNNQIIGINNEYKSEGDATPTRLYANDVSNKKYLNISWIAGEEEFTVTGVKCKFYPLTFETGTDDSPNKNYPYKSTYSNIFDLMLNTTTEITSSTINGVVTATTRTKSAQINLVQDGRYNGTSTMQGMYVVERTYKNGTTDSYYFYIDRNNIISLDQSIQSKCIGSDIKMIVGDSVTQFTYAGKEFLQEYVNDYIFSTNKQPASLNVPQYKYYQSGLSSYMQNPQNTKIGINRLKWVITDQNGYEASTSNSNTKFNFGDVYEDEASVSLWSVKIFDSADSTYYNSIQFNVAVNLYAPQASFINSKTTAVLEPGENNSISLNNTDVSLIWDNVLPNSVNAMIDEDNITITQVLESGRQNVLYKVVDGTVTTNIANVQTLVTLKNGKKQIDFKNFQSKILGVNCRIEVVLKYKTTSAEYYGNYLSIKKSIYFDFKRPETNYKQLFNADNYLASKGVSYDSFSNYNSDINFENYAFIVPINFSLTNPAPDLAFWQYGFVGATTNPNDVMQVWERKYNKYSSSDPESYQSVVPDDGRSESEIPSRLTFNENDPKYYEITQYTSINGFEFDEAGYYEIIEKDCAGNYRIYTIYVTQDSAETPERINYLETIDDVSSPDGKIKNPASLNITSNRVQEINNQKIEFTSFDNLGDWFTIDVLNGTTGNKIITTLNVAPVSLDGYVTFATAMGTINQNIIDDQNVGKYYIIKIQSAKYSEILINFRTPGQQYDLDLTIRPTSLTLTIDPNKYGNVYLKKLKITENGKTILTKDSNGKVIKDVYSTSDPVISYIFTYSSSIPRNLMFEYNDNFGIVKRINKILGITQTPYEEMLIFNDVNIKNDNFKGISILKDNFDEFDPNLDYITEIMAKDFYRYSEYYTSSQVKLEFQPQIYSGFVIYKYNEDGKLTMLYEYDPDMSKVNYIDIFENDLENTDSHYIVVFKDTTDNYYQFSLHHYTKLADVQFIDENNNTHDFDEESPYYESTVTGNIRISYSANDTLASYPIKTTVTATRTYTNSNNVQVTVELGNIVNNAMFSDYGTYVITVQNELGISKKYTFQYKQSDANYYLVKVNINGKATVLSPAKTQYYYGNTGIDNYLSIYDATIDVNQQKNLKISVEYQDDGGYPAVTIYKIYSDNGINYEKYIAVTKISTASSLLDDNSSIQEISEQSGDTTTEPTNYITSKYLKTNASGVRLVVPKYFETEANLIKVSVVYNNNNLGVISGTENEDDAYWQFDFTTVGKYKIYIADSAGNRHSFNGTAYFELNLINNFTYTINGADGIYNSIFNSAVNFAVTGQSNFVKDSTNSYYTLTATKNGASYTPEYSNGAYHFDSYGTYVVTLKGYTNKDANGNLIGEVVTTAKFTILNKNEAYTMHEYIGLNGYEVTKIVKNGVDVTSQIRENLGTATINKFAISGLKDGIGGSGLYQITVKVSVDKITADRQFDYQVWINNDNELLISTSIDKGSATTKPINLTLNLYQIYSRIGECYLKVDGQTLVSINQNTATNDVATVYTITENARHNVTLETADGNTLVSFVVTKNEPLNTVAIIVIVASCLAVAGLTITFILLRKKMRVR